MDLDAHQIGYFIKQVGLSAASFGVPNEDVAIVGKALEDTFGYKCSPPKTVVKAQGDELQSICQDDTCPMDRMGSQSVCTSYMSGDTEGKNDSSSSSTTVPQSSSTTVPHSSSTTVLYSPGTVVPSSTSTSAPNAATEDHLPTPFPTRAKIGLGVGLGVFCLVVIGILVCLELCASSNQVLHTLICNCCCFHELFSYLTCADTRV